MKELAYGATDVGRKRENNEDAYRLLPDRNIYIVADGMGGHNAGEVASRNAVEMVDRYFTRERVSAMKMSREQIKQEMIDALLHAHEGILEMTRTAREYDGMGCTIAVAFIADGMLHACHVGDSRVYVINQAGIEQITNDHSSVWELVRAGHLTREEARHSPLKNQITQALGSPYSVLPDYTERALHKGDKVLLCSDGLWDMLTDEGIHEIVMESGGLKRACKKLIEEANEAGGEDNITVVLARL